MTKQIKIKRGLDIKLMGKAEEKLQTIKSKRYALKPTDFHGLFPKLLVKVGDQVQRGTPVYSDKNRDYIKFTSPVSGVVADIVRGEKRKIFEIIIESDGSDSFVKFDVADYKSKSAETLKSLLVESGIWAYIRQRPYNVVANPIDKPNAIFISAFDTAPLAANVDFTMQGKKEAFQAGINALSKIGNCKIYLGINSQTRCETFTQAQGVEVIGFDGPHPAGNVGIQIHHVSPINKGDIYWTVQPQDVATIGNLFLKGQYDSQLNIAVCGSEVKNPQYYTVNRGSEVAPLLKDNLKVEDNFRIISGNVLTGTKVEKTGFISFYHNSLTIIPEGFKRDFMGWLIPSPEKHSFYRTSLSWLMPNKEYRLNTNINGGERAFVFTGEMEKVFPMNIYPMQLLKSIIVEDIDQMEQLGIYEVVEEDFALCEYISTSKIEIQDLIRQGLDMVRKEMS
jgi:Na+-transporting NADH:ubiquinone oxidoreductase subunit A